MEVCKSIEVTIQYTNMFSGSLIYIGNVKRPREVGRECNSKIFVVTRPGKEVVVSRHSSNVGTVGSSFLEKIM